VNLFLTNKLCSYTRDGLLFNYDYKNDLQKTAVERERIFVTRNVRHDTEESDEEGYFDKVPAEEAEVEDEKPTAGKPSKKKGVQFNSAPVVLEEEEEE
jgi:hypothetical protein